MALPNLSNLALRLIEAHAVPNALGNEKRTAREPPWYETRRTDANHARGLALLSYTRHFDVPIINEMRRLPTSLYLAAHDLPTDKYEAQEMLAKRLPNLVFFAPMKALNEMVAPLRIEPQQISVELKKNPVRGQLRDGCNLAVFISKVDSHLPSDNDLDETVSIKGMELLDEIFGLTAKRLVYSKPRAVDQVWKSMISRMEAALMASMRSITAETFKKKLYRGISNIPLNMTPSELICKFNTLMSTSTVMQVSESFAKSSEDSKKTGPVLVVLTICTACIIDVDDELPEEYTCYEEREILLAPNHTFTPTGEIQWSLNTRDMSWLRKINYEVTYESNPPIYRWDSNPADPHWVKDDAVQEIQ
jgi:hypothetical protein